jgi:hypothetical protein
MHAHMIGISPLVKVDHAQLPTGLARRCDRSPRWRIPETKGRCKPIETPCSDVE